MLNEGHQKMALSKKISTNKLLETCECLFDCLLNKHERPPTLTCEYTHLATKTSTKCYSIIFLFYEEYL